MEKTTLADGSPVTEDHRELKANGQQKDYVVLSDEERAKGFVRPVRTDYVHTCIKPRYSTRPLTDEEKERHAGCDYELYEGYPESEYPLTGRFWTAKQLNSGCGARTVMSRAIAETYARSPGFYSGTFCCGCGEHFPVGEFEWDGTDERVGS